MSIVNDVITIIRNNPGITAAEIKECAGITDPTVKATLWRLYDLKRIHRNKTEQNNRKGPRTVYAYYLKEQEHGVQEETGKEVNAQQVTSSGQTDGSGSPRSTVRKEGGYPPLYR